MDSITTTSLPEPLKRVLLDMIAGKDMFQCMQTVQEEIYRIEKLPESSINNFSKDILLFLNHAYWKKIRRTPE